MKYEGCNEENMLGLHAKFLDVFIIQSEMSISWRCDIHWSIFVQAVRIT